ncbi:MAG: nitrogen fixation protein FixH [Gammaproteobacteria bacterium]|nr:MAG: nitrogen fixation protein FixH [Gammaproteobacteria bacterium]
MNELVASLGIGILLIVAVFVLLYRYTRMQGKQVALLVFLAAMGVYVPMVILKWPGMDVVAIHVALYGVIPYVLGIITSHWEHQERMGVRNEGRWFHWYPAILVGFFVTIAVVDSIIITLAQQGFSNPVIQALAPEEARHGRITSVFPGTIAHDFQEKEKDYNAYLRQLEIQKKRGWQVNQGFLETPHENTPTDFRIQVLDREGRPVEGAEVEVRFLRPSDKRLDQQFDLKELEPGMYGVQVRLPGKGRWYVVGLIRRGKDLHETRGWTYIEPEGHTAGQ